MRAISVAASAALLLNSFCDASTLTPPVLPLIVRNPYLSTWLPDARDEPWSKWPMFWTGQSMGFGVLASLPHSSTVYPLLGRPHDSLDYDSDHYSVAYPRYLGSNYDASTTNLTYSISSSGSNSSVEITLSFLSPITPTSTLRQAIPASYLTVHVKGRYEVDIYVDVNGQWVSGNRGSRIEWDLHHSSETNASELKTFRVKRSTQETFVEWQDRAEWGTLHFTGPASAHHECGTSRLLRQRFSRFGKLNNAVDDGFRAIMDEEPAFAFSKSFNLSYGHSEDSALFTITHIQNPVTQFASSRGLTLMRPLWMSYFFSDEDLISFHYDDYEHARALAADYSLQVAKDAYASGSDEYKDIVELSARQVLGATSFSGTPENPILFLKEISSNGNCQTVDVIFPAFPFFLYTNPKWLAYLLEPLLEHMLSGQYPNNYTMHDLGYHFPNMTGHADGRDEYMPVEECGDILIMGLALVNSLQYGTASQAQSPWSALGKSMSVAEIEMQSEDASPFSLSTTLETRDGIPLLDGQWGGVSSEHQAKKWVSRTYSLWKQWTGYLVDYSLYPANQLCTDDFAGWLPLMTNLALKGIVGIKAMSELAEVVGEKEDAKHYRNISEAYIKEWETQGISRDGGRAKLAYNWYGSWTTLYSLYADALLCFHPSLNATPSTANLHQQAELQEPLLPNQPLSKENFIPDRIYKAQSDWYATVMQKYGLPLDSRHLYTKSDWEFQAAAVAGKKTRAQILDKVAFWLNETAANRPFTDLYKTEGDGGFPGPDFFARPVVGSHFAFLTLERACQGKGMEAFQYE